MKFEKLITTRKQKGLSQETMASKVGMEQTTYSRKERGLSFIHEDEWEKFAKVLKVDVNSIKEEHHFVNNETYKSFGHSPCVEYVNVPKDMYELLMQHFKKMNADIER
jgi:transcriptional regulator with XRE-family HTH domain